MSLNYLQKLSNETFDIMEQDKENVFKKIDIIRKLLDNDFKKFESIIQFSAYKNNQIIVKFCLFKKGTDDYISYSNYINVSYKEIKHNFEKVLLNECNSECIICNEERFLSDICKKCKNFICHKCVDNINLENINNKKYSFTCPFCRNNAPMICSKKLLELIDYTKVPKKIINYIIEMNGTR